MITCVDGMCAQMFCLLQQTLFEIIMSEASYLKSLHLVIKHFAQSVEFDALHSPAAILTKRDYKILFSNIESVWTVSARWVCVCLHACVCVAGFQGKT